MNDSSENRENLHSKNKKPIKVFISYSWDSEEFIELVISLSNRLRTDGIDSNIDLYEISPTQGWSRWMEDQIEESDFVLIICTALYYRRFRGKIENKSGKGVAWEGAIITNDLYANHTRNTRFIPIIFNSSDFQHIPTILKSATYYDLQESNGYFRLYRHLTEQPEFTKPVLGAIKQLETKNIYSTNVKALSLNDDESDSNQIKRENLKIDWGGAPDVSSFFGRQNELITLRHWILEKNCNIVLILGIGGIGKTGLAVKLGKGGIGKTDLSLKLADGIMNDFKYVVWRKVLNVPPLHELLTDIILFLSDKNIPSIPESEDALINLFIDYIKKYKCLIMIDNLESLISSEESGKFKSGYNNYETLMENISNTEHHSCVIFTSREKPSIFSRLEGKDKPVRTLLLNGLGLEETKNIFREIGEFKGSDTAWNSLVEFYNGNPLALELTARHINEIYFGDIDDFFNSGSQIFADLKELLDWHLKRLSSDEKEILFWLAIEREPIALWALKDNLLSDRSRISLPDNMQTLQRRIPLEKSDKAFSLQPVLIEHVTDRFVLQTGEEVRIFNSIGYRHISDVLINDIKYEIISDNANLLMSHSLLKATAKEYIRESQIRCIINPLINSLSHYYKSHHNIIKQLMDILRSLQDSDDYTSGYAPGNIINILIAMKADLTGYDFSHLPIFQACLDNSQFVDVNFSFCHFKNTLFQQSFSGVLSVKFSQKGDYLATSDVDNAISIWHTDAGQLVCKCIGHQNWVGSIAFSPGNKILASVSNDSSVKIWDYLACTEIYSFNHHRGRLRVITFSPNGEFIASSGDEAEIIVMKLFPSPEIQDRLTHHDSSVWALEFSPDGKSLASAGEDGKIIIWDTIDKCIIHIHHMDNDWIRDLSFNSDGSLLASVGDKGIVSIWDCSNHELLSQMKAHDTKSKSIQFANDKILLSAGDDGLIKAHNIISWENRFVTMAHKVPIREIDYSPDKQLIVSGSEDQSVKIWDFHDGRCIKTIQGYGDKIWSVAFSIDGKKLFSGGEDGQVRQWDLDKGKCEFVYYGHKRRVWSVKVDSQGKFIASGGEDQTARIWDIQTGECIRILKGHIHWVWPVAISRDSKFIATGSEDQFKIWDIASGTCLKTINTNIGKWIRSLDFSSDGSRLAAASDTPPEITIWSIPEFSNIMRLTQHSGKVTSVKFFDDDKYIVSGSEDKTVKVWNSITGDCLTTFSGHHGVVTSVDASQNHKLLASGSEDKTIRIWDIETEKCILTLTGHQGYVWSVSFSPENELIASSDNEGCIKIWYLSTGKCLQTLYVERPYERSNFKNSKGLLPGQIHSLSVLGAITD